KRLYKNISVGLFYEHIISRCFSFLAYDLYYADLIFHRIQDRDVCYLPDICIGNRYFKSNDGTKDQEKTDAAQYSNTKPYQWARIAGIRAGVTLGTDILFKGSLRSFYSE